MTIIGQGVHNLYIKVNLKTANSWRLLEIRRSRGSRRVIGQFELISVIERLLYHVPSPNPLQVVAGRKLSAGPIHVRGLPAAHYCPLDDFAYTGRSAPERFRRL